MTCSHSSLYFFFFLHLLPRRLVFYFRIRKINLLRHTAPLTLALWAVVGARAVAERGVGAQADAEWCQAGNPPSTAVETAQPLTGAKARTGQAPHHGEAVGVGTGELGLPRG